MHYVASCRLWVSGVLVFPAAEEFVVVFDVYFI